MTHDTIFRSVAALRLVEQGKLSLEAPANIDPVIGAPQVLDGFDVAGKTLLRPASGRFRSMTS